jgi:hypothetical protein
MFGRRKKKEPSLQDLFDLALDDLRNVQEIEALAKTPGWITLRAQLERRVEAIQFEINKLACAPVENEKRLVWYAALRDAVTWFIGQLDEATASGADIRAQVKIRNEQLKQAALNRDRFDG